jgi:DNA polymerase-3 subunit beta
MNAQMTATDTAAECATMLTGAHIKALLRCAGDKDVRYYLNGICFDPAGYAVATNGHILLAVRCEPFDGAQFIVPRDVLRAALKRVGESKSRRYGFAVTPTQLDGEAYTAIDGTYPDWRRVVPQKCNGDMLSGKNSAPVAYDPRYVTTFEECARDLGLGIPERCYVNIAPNGGGAGIAMSVDLPRDLVLGIIMPMNVERIDDALLTTLATDTAAFMAPA